MTLHSPDSISRPERPDRSSTPERALPASRLVRSARPGLPRALVVALGLLAVALFGVGIFALSFRAELDQAAERGRSDLSLSADRLTTGLQRYRELAVFLSDHPTVLSRAKGGGDEAATDKLLQSMVDKTGARSMLIVNRAGEPVSRGGEENLVFGVQAAVTRALGGALGIAHFVDQDGRRRYAFAAPVFDGGPPLAAVLVTVEIDLLEWGWPSEADTVYFTDEYGVIFVSNRSELVLKGGLAGPFEVKGAYEIAGQTIWIHDFGPYVPSPALHLTKPLPVAELEATLLTDLRPVIMLAGFQAGMAAALALVFAAFLLFAMERRRTLWETNTRLEARVAARTEALEIANRELQHEVHEREEAEARLKRAQADLVQAGKLSALGEMSAGISHELNQPLMAIRSFAENAQAFLDRGKPEKAADNLGRISDLSRRMGRIIKNLRAFARQDSESLTNVDLTAVVEAALEMAQAKLSRGEVTLDWSPGGKVWVRGGEVRLQQVVLNLLSNAVDATEGCDDRRIAIRIVPSTVEGEYTRLSVSDTGPGIEDPEKIFDPFYTTKEVGAAQGMGLGLSISYGLVQSFGGRIRGENGPEGGAIFTIDLISATPPYEEAQDGTY